jgi:hypothetical protein
MKIGDHVKFSDNCVYGTGRIVGVPNRKEQRSFDWTVVSDEDGEFFYEKMDGYSGMKVRHFKERDLEVLKHVAKKEEKMNTARIAQAISEIEKHEAALKWFENYNEGTAWEKSDVKVRSFHHGTGHDEAMEIMTSYAYFALSDIQKVAIQSCHNTIAVCKDIIKAESAKV